MRLIDADALIDFIDCGHLRNPLEACFSERDVVDMLESRPTIDAVDVVRCKGCEAYQPTEGGKPLCVVHQTAVYADDYCSYGERKESEST